MAETDSNEDVSVDQALKEAFGDDESAPLVDQISKMIDDEEESEEDTGEDDDTESSQNNSDKDQGGEDAEDQSNVHSIELGKALERINQLEKTLEEKQEKAVEKEEPIDVETVIDIPDDYKDLVPTFTKMAEMINSSSQAKKIQELDRRISDLVSEAKADKVRLDKGVAPEEEAPILEFASSIGVTEFKDPEQLKRVIDLYRKTHPAKGPKKKKLNPNPPNRLSMSSTTQASQDADTGAIRTSTFDSVFDQTLKKLVRESRS